MSKENNPLKKNGFSVISIKITKVITEEDLTKELVKKVGSRINVKIDKDEKNNN